VLDQRARFARRLPRCDRVAPMAERTEYAPGTFSWTDLSTTDPEAAKSFYAALFGWQSEDLPVPGGSMYSMQQLEG
jgi:predicted enzyme related to lactoylglutathione lyase